MQMEGTRSFNQPPAAVFRALTDPELVADALPGVGRVDVRDGDHWNAQIALPFVARAPRLRFEFAVLERDEPARARLLSVGRTLGTSLRVEMAMTLTETESGTSMAYAVALRPGGLLARLPEHVVQRGAEAVLSRLLAAIERSAARYAAS